MKTGIIENTAERKREERRKKQRMYAAMRVQAVVFGVVLLAGFITALILPLRPKVSETEKRELTKFPEFSAESLLSGEYFSGISLWYADTFPGRESLMKINGCVNTFLTGAREVQIHGEVEKGDEIPDAPLGPMDGERTENGDAPVVNEPDVSKPVEDVPPVIEASGETQSFSAVLLAGNAAYEYYSFVQETADKYITAVNTAASELEGKAKVYDMVVPTSMGITLPDSLKESVSSSDQKKAIEYMYGSMDGAITVDIFDRLIEHRDEYIYFRTDHHWTMLGAYYAYAEFCKAVGFKPMDIESYEKREYEGFLGSFYASTEKAPALGENPDTLEAYVPAADTETVITDKNGKTFAWFLIADATDYGAGLKYSAIAGGDNPYTIIKNKDISDGSSILVVKESYGNAFVPFLTNHYENVHIIDYRYWNGKISDFVMENGVEEVLIINNISATRAGSLMDKLAGVLK